MVSSLTHPYSEWTVAQQRMGVWNWNGICCSESMS